MSTKPNVDDLAKQLLSHRALSVLGRGDLHVDMGNGIVLKTNWFDHDNKLVGTIKTPEKRLPLLEQCIIEERIRGEFVQVKTEEQACASLAQEAIKLVDKLAKAA